MDAVEVTMSFLKGAIPTTAGVVILLVIFEKLVNKLKWIAPLALFLGGAIALYIAKDNEYNFRMMRNVNGQLSLSQVLRVTTNWGIYSSVLVVPFVAFLFRVLHPKRDEKGMPNQEVEPKGST